MRKKFLLMIFVLSLFTSMGGGWLHAQTKNGVSSTSTETITFEDDFTSLDEEFWTQIDDDGDGKKWYYENDHIISKSYYDGFGAFDPEDYIVTTSSYTLSESSVLTLHIGPNGGYNYNAYRVVISEDMINWITVYEENFGNTYYISPQERSISLSEHSGQTVHVGVLHYFGDEYDGSGIIIDYIKLTGAAPAAEPVAKIGDTPYNSLAEAVTAATAGQTITLLADVELTEMVTIPEGKVLALDLNGQAITVPEATERHIYALNNKGTLTIKDSNGNGSISARGIYNGYDGVSSNNTVEGAKLIIESGKFIALDSDGGAAIFNCAELVINDGTFKGIVAAVNNRAMGVATINGGTFAGGYDGGKSTNYIIQNNGGSLTINDANVVSGFGAVGCYSGETIINGGSFLPTGWEGYTCHVVYVAGAADVTINGGTFKMNYPADATPDSGSAVASYYNGKLSITGGSFTAHFDNVSPVELSDGSVITGGSYYNHSGVASTHSWVTNFIKDGYELGANGTVAAKPVAEVNGVKYASFAEAVAAAQNGETITLIDNVVLAERVTIPADKTLTIDLNGKSISMEESIIATAYAINNLGNLTITDVVGGGSINARGIYNGYGDGAANVATAKIIVLSGTINAKGTNGGAAVYNYGIAEIKGGTFTSIGGYSLNSQSGASMTIADGVTANNGIYVSGATLVVDGGEISGNRSGCHVLYAWNSTVTIKGGEFYNNNSGNSTTMAAGTTELTINGGTFGIKDGRVPGNGNTWTSCLTDAANTAKIIVNDGTFNGGVRVQGGATMTINGGSFNDVTGSGYNVYTGATVEVKGGTFTDAAAQTFAKNNIADDYKLGEDGKVVYTPVVAKIGETKYETLDAAFAAATEGQTITLLADATPALTSQRAITKAAVIDLGGKTLNLTEDDLYFGTTTFKNGTIVVDPSVVKPSTAVFWMFANQTLTFDNVKIVATGVTGTYLIGINGGTGTAVNLLNGSSITIDNESTAGLTAVICDNGTDNTVTIDKSVIAVKNIEGRFYLGGKNGDVSVKNTIITLNGVKEGFYLRAGQSLDIAGTSTVDITLNSTEGRYGINVTDRTATYTKAEGATVNATVYEIKVAKIGETTYKSLIEAAAAVQDGETITLIADEIFTATNYTDNGGWRDGLGYAGDKSFTIDLNDFTVSQDGSLNDYLFWFKNAGSKANTITIKNGTLDAGTTAYCALCTASSHDNQLTINTEDLNLINNISNGSTVKVRAGSVLNVKEGTKITGKNSYLGIENWNATVNIYDGAEIYMNGTSSYNGCLVGVGGNGTVNVYGGYGKGVKGGFIAMTSGGTINVAGGEWIANTDGTVGNNSNLYVLTAQSNKYESGFAGPSIINVTGGTLRGGMDAWVLNNIEGEKAELNITGGNFNANPASYVEAGYVATEAAGIYTVVEAPAYIDGKASYASLAAAYEAAVNGDVIVLNESVTTFPVINKAVTFKGGKENAAVEINYALSQNFTAIDGIVRFENLTFNKPLFTEHGGNKPGLSIEFEGCNFNVNSEAGYGILIGTSWSNSVVKGLKVNNCNFEYVGTEFKGGYMLYVQCVNEVTITNNTIDGNNLYRGAIHLGDATEHATVATVSNNTIKNFCRGVMMGNRVAGSSATISNNTFDNINYSNKDSKPAQECAPIFIHSNATAEALQIALTDNKVTNCNNPMIYSEDTDLIKYYVTEFTGNTVDGTAVEFANSYNAPNQVFPVATINDAEYFTLQAAIDAVQNGETIVLTKDCAEVVSINKSNVAFTINGKISDTENIAYTGKIQINVGQNVTVKNINFSHAGDEAHDFIANVGSPTGKNYNTTLLVEGCSFVGGNNNYNTVAVRTIHPTHTQIKNSTGTGLHSFLQNTGGQQVTVEGVVLTDSKGGLAIGSPNGAVSVKGCDLTTNTYGVRLDANNTNAPGTTLENNKVNAYIPVSVRKATAPNYNLTFNGEENAYVATNGDNVWCAVCTTEYEEGVALNAPTGKVRVTLNDTELSYERVYGNYYELAGEGTAENPYLINSVYDLKYFRDKVDEQAQDGSTQFAGKYFKLTADLDLAGINWNPIGSMSGDHGSFKGVFDGGNHTISNLNCEQAGNGLGLFARTAGNAEIKNLKLNNVTVKSTDNSNYVGVVVGNAYASTKINNVHVSGTINIAGRGYIGGIAGHGYVVMDNVSVVANEGSLITSTFWCAGGILGYAGEGSTNIMNANVEGITITSAAGGLGAIVGMAEDNNGTQPISGSNLSAKNVEIKTYVGAYGTSYANYALGYLYGGNETSILTGELSVENVNVITSTGEKAKVVDAVANVDGAIYFNITEAFAAAQEGDNVAILKAGTYALKVKDGLTITGDVDGVEFANIGAFGCNGANVTFNNVTFTYANNSTYKGLQHSGNLVYNNCTFNGQVFLYGASETFNNCTFNTTDSNNYNVWTYGAKKVAFNECTFNSAGKSVLIYAESASVFNDVTVTACTFIASTAVDGKAAIEMDSSLTGGINLTIDAETTASGFGKGNVSDNSLWNNKKGNADVANNDITVKVGDVVVLAPIYEAQIGETKYRKLADAFAAAQAGDVVKVFAGTYAMPAMKAGIKVEGAVNADGTPAVLFNGTLKGTLENLTMKNIHIKGGNAQRWAYAKGNLVFENVTFEATSVYALHFDGIAAGTNLTYTNCTIIGWAAMGGSPASCTFDGCTIKGNGTYGVIRTYFDATIKNCTFDVANVNTTDVYQDGIHAVEGAQVVVENCTNANGDMKDLVNVHANSVVTVDGVAIKNAAKINDNYYRTLAEAIDAIGSGNVVIELLDDATLNYGAREAYGTAETTSLTINGNGKVITLNQTNSDWSSFGLANAEAKVVFNNMTIEKTGKGDTSGAWNTHAIIFSSNVEMNEVTVNNAIAVQDGAILNNVAINEANGYYGLWINGNGQSVTMNGGSITATNGGRGIKIADQYIDAPAQVTLNVTGTDFNTAKKAAVLVSSKAGAEITASNVNIEDVTADKVNFVWVDEDWAANFGNVEVTGATVAQEGIENFVAEVKKDAKVEGYYASLQAAVNAVQNGETVSLLKDIAENVTVSQNNGINIVIDGQNHNFSGTITIDGNSRTTGESLTIQNVNFVTNVASLYFIDANSTENTDRYPHNVTVKDCTFTAEENSAAVNTAVAMRFRQGFNIAVENVTAVRLHSLMQNYGVSGVTVNDVEVDGKNGIALGTSTNVTVTDATIKAVGYGLRVDASVTTPITIADSEIDAFIPVVVRYASADASLTFNGTNTFSATNKDGYWCVIGTSEYEEDGKLPTAATGNVFVSLNDEDLNYKGIYGHYAVAQIGDVKYATLQAAVNAVQNGETITVIRDIALTEAITVAAGAELTLDLNGKVVSYESAVVGEDMITNNGKLTIESSVAGGEITYKNTDETGANVTVNTISTVAGSELIINGGIIKNTSSANNTSKVLVPYAIDILTNGNLGDVNVTINGGEIVCENYIAIRQFNNGDVCKNTLTVNDGYIYGAKRAIQIHLKNNAAYTTISGGKIEANDYSLCFLTTSENILVEGGEFIGAVWYSGTKGFIKGGTFTTDVTNYIAPGYSCKQNAEGKYVVKFANVEIYYTAAGVETTKDQAVYSLSFAVTDYDNKEASVKIGSKKPTTKDRIEIVTPATVAFEGVEYKVTSLANNAFDGVRGIKEIIISEGVKSLGSKALANMYELVDVVLPSTLVSVGNQCFYGYGSDPKIKTITCLAVTPPTASGHWQTSSFQTWVAENVILFVAGDANVYKKAAGWSKFTNILGINSEIEIPGNYNLYTMKVNVTSVSPRTASIKIGRRFPEGVPAILDTIPETASFYGNEFQITSIPEKGFQGVKFEKIVIPGNIKNIGNTAFGGSNLADTLIIEEGVQTLGNFAFQGCYSLSEIILPSTLQSVGEKCFNNVGVASTNQEAVEVSLVYTGVTPPTAGANLFSNNIQGTLYVPTLEVVESFKAAAGWNISSIKPFEAKIGETVYYSLAKAIKASKAGDVITLIADVETAKANPIIIPEGVTLDINTHDIIANIYGTVKTAGGLWTTVAVPGFNSRDMLGDGAIYNTTDATVVNLANEVKVLAGTIVLNPHPEKEWWTLPGQSLSIATGATFEIPSGVKFTVREGNANVNGTLINNGTLAINAGATVTGNLTGDIHFLGGNFITADGYKMVGTTSEYFYNATNALVNIESTFGDITILSGAMTLGQSWRTVQGQTLTVAEGASFTVPTGMTFEVFANTHVVVEGTLVTEGTVYLQAGATVKAEAGLNIQTTVAGHVVDYNNGVYSVVEQTIFTQTIQLNAGWNWFSSYVETDLESLQAALGTSGVQIKSDNDGYDLYYAGYGWGGSLNTIESSQMYMIQTSAAHELVLSGELLENVEITLNPGWNWISFPMNANISVADAFAGLSPNTNDQIKSDAEGYALYYAGYGWGGSLNTLKPGQGYMYYSSSETPVTFTYSPSMSKSEAKANVTTDGNYWTPNAAQFANNMTMTAVLDVENINYEVAAFVNGECRGSARPIYVEALDAYMLFLTIHGEEVEEMTFKYYDIDTDTEYTLSDRINYSNNAILGSLKEPYMFTRGTTGIGEAELSQLNIYPNPTTTAAEINLNATFDKVEVFNALGVKVAEYSNVDSIDALETAGIYVIRATNNSVISHCRLVVK